MNADHGILILIFILQPCGGRLISIAVAVEDSLFAFDALSSGPGLYDNIRVLFEMK